MKILSNKKYNKLIEDFEKSQKKVEELNNGKDFCFYCKNSYRYKTYWGVTEIEKCGCLLDVSCEDFKKREDN